MARLELHNLCKTYGRLQTISDVSVSVPDGEFLVLLGPSGCGKTTTLRMIAGFVEPTSGAITLGEREITHLPPWKRNAGLVFQGYALFPHMTVAENVMFGLEMRGVGRAEREAAALDALRMVRLERYTDRYPRQLSGGQQQRVALARALVIRPDVLLLDEPLSNLDAKLREEVRHEIRLLQQRLELTTVMVTHDQEEALAMADRLAVMAEGEVRQIGSQSDLYERPADRFVAGFIGRSTMLEGRFSDTQTFRAAGGADIRCDARHPAGAGVLALRPENIQLDPEPDVENVFDATVEIAVYLGAIIELRLRLAGTEDRIVVHVPNRDGNDSLITAIGSTVRVGWPATGGIGFAA